jgi:hypothetical protein
MDSQLNISTTEIDVSQPITVKIENMIKINLNFQKSSNNNQFFLSLNVI